MKSLIFVYLLTYGGAAAALLNPLVGLYIYILFAILKPESLWSFSVPLGGHYSRIVAIAMLIGWAWQGFGNWNLRGCRAIVAALAGYWFWQLLSACFSPNPDRAWADVDGTTKILLPFLVAVTTIDSVQKLRQLVWVMLFGFGFVAYEMNLSYLQGYNRIQLGTLGGLDNNGMALLMAGGAALGLCYGLGEKIWWRKWLAFAASAAMAHAVLLSFSRGGMLALLVSGALIFLLIPKRPAHWLVLALAVLMTLRLAGPEVRQRFFTAFEEREQLDASAANRLDYWKIGWELMMREPLLGVGAGAFRMAATEHSPEKASPYTGLVQEAHSTWFQVGAELGVPALLCLMSFFGLGIWQGVVLARRRGAADDFLQTVGQAGAAGITAFCAAATFLTAYGIEGPFYATLLVAVASRLAIVLGEHTPGGYVGLGSQTNDLAGQWRAAP